MPVYLDNGRLLGRTREIGHAVDYLHVQQGHVLVRDWYIPVTAVRDVTAAGVYLEANLSELRAKHSNVPRAAFLARQGATPGYEYTTESGIPSVEDSRSQDVASWEAPLKYVQER